MNWFTWHLFEDETNGYFWRIFFVCLFTYIFNGPTLGLMLLNIVLFDYVYWTFQAKPKRKANER